jgi:hypothetical protein
VAVELVLLSRVAYRDREIVGPRLRGLLALLAGDLRSGCSTARLVDGLWPGEQPENPAKALQILVSRTRALMGSEVIVRTPTGYRLSLPVLRVRGDQLHLNHGQPRPGADPALRDTDQAGGDLTGPHVLGDEEVSRPDRMVPVEQVANPRGHTRVRLAAGHLLQLDRAVQLGKRGDVLGPPRPHQIPIHGHGHRCSPHPPPPATPFRATDRQ